MNIDYKYRYFKTAIQHISKNRCLIGLAMACEVVMLFVHSLESCLILKTIATKPSLFYFKYISPFYYFRSYMLESEISNGNNSFSIYPNGTIIPLGIVIFLFYIYIFFFCEKAESNLDEKRNYSKFKKISHSIMVNLYEFLFLRVLSLFSIDISINFFLTYAVNSSMYSFFVIIASCLPCLVLCLGIYQHFENYHMWIIFDNSTTLPFERDGSVKFDKFLLLLKIFISLELNMQSISYLPVICAKFMSLVIVVSIFLVALFSICDLIRGYLPFGNSPFFSSFRLLFVIFTGTWIIVFLLFEDSFSLLTLSIAVFLCLLFFAWYYNLDLQERAFNSNSDMLPKIKLILSLITSGESVEAIKPIITFHMIQCNADCPFCKKIIHKKQKSETTVLTLFDYLKLLFKVLNEERKLSHSFDQIAYKELSKLLAKYLKHEKNLNYKLYIIFSKLMAKYRKSKDSLELNLILLYDCIRSRNKLSEEYTQFEQIEIISNFLINLRTSLNSFENFLSCHSQSPRDIMKISQEIFELKKHPSISYLLNRETYSNYQTFLTRFILEEFFNSPAKSQLGLLRDDIKLYEEFLNQHFIYDKIMSIKYVLTNGEMDISRTGSDLLCFINSPFDHIFPPDFRQAGMIQFHNAIIHNNIFDFVIRGPEDNFVELFKIKLKICPGINEFELWINGEYSYNYDWILVTEDLNRKGKMLEVIHSLSRDTGNILKLTPEILCILKGVDSYFYIQDILKPCEDNVGTLKGNNFFELDMEQYIQIYQLNMGMLKYNSQFTQFSNLGNACYSLIELENLKRSSTVFCTNKFSFESSGKRYKVYSVRCHHAEVDTHEINLMKLSPTHEDNMKVINSYYGNTCDDFGKAFGSASLQPSGCSMLSPGLSYQIDERYKQIKISQQRKSERNFKWISWFIILFSAGLIALSVSIVIVDLNDNQKLQNVFGTFYDYRGINRLYYHVVLSIICNVCIGEPLSPNCVNQYVLYSKKFREERNAKYNIYAYIDKELSMKLSDLLTRIANFQIELYNLNNMEVSEAFHTKFDFFTLRLIGGKLTFQKQELSFIDALNIYVNLIKAMLQVKGYISIPVYIFTTDSWNHFDFSNVYNKSSLNEFQMNYYNILLNYVRYLQIFADIGNLLKKQLLEIISYNEFLNLVFTISMIGLHCLLFALCFFFISSFRKIVKILVSKMMFRLSKEKILKFLLKKVEYLQILCKIYAKNPNAIIHSLQSLYEEASTLSPDSDMKKSKCYERKVTTTLSTALEGNRRANTNYFQWREYMFIAIRFYKILVAMASVYVLAMLIFYYMLTASLNQTRIVIQYIDTHNIVENNMFNNFGLIQLMNLANQTEAMISLSLGGDDLQGYDYITRQIKKTVEMISSLMVLEKNYQSFLPQGHSLKWHCKELYSTLNDARMVKISKGTPELNYTGMFVEICESYPIMAAKDLKLLDLMIEYDCLKLLNRMQSMKYTDLYRVRNLKESFDLYSAILLIYRPIRTYINQVILNGAIKSACDYLVQIIICYLILSICGEIFILVILLFLFLRKIKRVNKNLITLEKCLKINK